MELTLMLEDVLENLQAELSIANQMESIVLLDLISKTAQLKQQMNAYELASFALKNNIKRAP